MDNSIKKSIFATSALLQSRKGLKPTATVVRDRKGRIHIEREELFTSKEERDKSVQASLDAMKKRPGAPPKLDFSFPIESGKLYEYNIRSYNVDEEKSVILDHWKPIITDQSFPSEASATNAADTTTNIRVITFNIWFSEYQWKCRLEALLKICLLGNNNNADNVDKIEGGAHVICLQEVTPRVITELLQNLIVQQNYRIVHNATRSYGCCMLIAKELSSLYNSTSIITLPTHMGRAGLVATFDIIAPRRSSNDNLSLASSLAICTVHLESLDNQELRGKQLDVLRKELSQYDVAVLCGDYNITATGPWANQEEDMNVLTKHLVGYQDLWLSENDHSVDEGMTFDSEQNLMQRLFSGKHFHDSSRYDRVCYTYNDKTNEEGKNESKIEQHQQQCDIHNICIIGNSPINGDKGNNDGDALFISDHFGLKFKIRLY